MAWGLQTFKWISVDSSVTYETHTELKTYINVSIRNYETVSNNKKPNIVLWNMHRLFSFSPFNLIGNSSHAILSSFLEFANKFLPKIVCLLHFRFPSNEIVANI